MPLTKRRRAQLWNGYIVGMVLFYGLCFWLGSLAFGSTAAGFVAGFASLFVSMIGFLVLMRRLSAPLETRQPADEQAQGADGQAGR